MKIAAIIPALNEQKTIAHVVDTVRRAGVAQEVIVVSDGSTDATASYARRAGARVIELPHTIGKGGAMAAGVNATDADILMFFDADLQGLRAEHVRMLLAPIALNEADMCIGVTDRWHALYTLNNMLRGAVPLVQLTGQRAMKRSLFEAVPEDLRKGFQVEEALNYHCKINTLRVQAVSLRGVHGIQKTAKYRFWKGMRASICMVGELIAIFFKVRFLHFIGKKT